MLLINKRFFLIYITAILVLTTIESQAQHKKKGSAFRDALNNTTADADGDSKINVPIVYDDFVYRPNIKTVQLHEESFELTQPILELGAAGRLKLSFDDLDTDYKNYSYTFIQCNADWLPSDLSAMDYIEGFTDNLVTDHQFSLNTLQSYTHYSTLFPNENFHFIKSGNYILKVYLDGNPDKLVLTKRFIIFENKLNIISKVKPATTVEFRNFKQEIDFTINHSQYAITDPYGDLKIVITQNNRWDNAKTGLKPVFVKDDELVYDYDEENVFDGGNEFRIFDIRSLRYQSERIRSIEKDSNGYHVLLMPDQKRSYKRYLTYTDMNGKYLIKVQEGSNSENEADYAYVNFFLPYDDALTDGKLYVFGAYNGFKCTSENLMHYNAKRFGYECDLYLKQGYYNYEYVFIKDAEQVADQTLVEGMHYETENDYTIYVYHRPPGTYYDQLIGMKRLNSMK